MNITNKARTCSRMFMCSLLFSITMLSSAEPLKEFQLCNGSIKVTDITGKPVKDVAVYGYCKELDLLWPRTPDNQYSLAWGQEFFARTNDEGTVRAEVPNGKWFFCAVGHIENNTILATDLLTEITADFSLTLSPELTIKSTYGLSPESHPNTDCVLSKLFITHSPVPLYVQVPVGEMEEIVFQTMRTLPFGIWGQGSTGDKSTVGVFDFGKLKEGRNRPESLNQILFDGDKDLSFDLKWTRRWRDGLADSVKINAGQRFSISNGKFSIGYKRQVGDLWCDFVSKYCNFSGQGKEILKINDNLRIDIWTQQKDEKSLVQLFAVDDNGFHIKQFYNNDGNQLKFDAMMKQGTQVLKSASYPRDMSFVFEDFKLTGKETWNFSIPLVAFKDKWFAKTPFVEPSGRFFTMKVPADLTSYAVNYLEQLDDISKRMQLVSGRKKQVSRTQLILNIESRTTGEVHGKNIATANHVFFRDFPIQRHSFPHEMAHNFGFLHGGLQEAVVDIVRSDSEFIIYGQESKWLFIDRMNDRNRKESWYPYTAIYMWGYSRGGQRFLHLLSKFEPSLLKEGETKGFSKEEIIGPMFCVFLKRDMFEISSKYGLCKDKSRYDEALKLIKGYLSLNRS